MKLVQLGFLALLVMLAGCSIGDATTPDDDDTQLPDMKTGNDDDNDDDKPPKDAGEKDDDDDKSTVCKPFEKKCEGKFVMMCDGYGDGWGILSECDEETEICQDAKCVPIGNDDDVVEPDDDDDDVDGGDEDTCVPNCEGKCGGAFDGCGGTCTASCGTGKVCQSQACVACGASGQPCCASNQCNSGLSCQSGTCQTTCTPNCTDKCGGASDGCGGTCTASCPSGKVCVSQACVACGAIGDPCCANEKCNFGLSCQSGMCLGTSQIAWLPKQIDFGLVTIGCNSQDITVTVYNNGAAPFSVTGVSTDSSPPFKVVRTVPPLPQGGQVDVGGGGSMQVVVRYTPTEPPKVEQGKLYIQTDASNIPGGKVEVPLRGEGTYESGTVDEFQQFTDFKVDNLWVVDNSGSMNEEQSAISSNFDVYITYATNLDVDYHIGVTSTEINEANKKGAKPGIIPGYLWASSGCPKIVTKATPNGIQCASQNIRVGTCCSDEQEAGLEASRLALDDPIINDPNANAGFLREDARLVIMYLSDDDDKSKGSISYYADFLLNIHGHRNYDLLRVSIIVGLTDTANPKPESCEGPGGSAGSAQRYYEVWKQINNGLAISICNNNWGSAMQKLGLYTFSRVQWPLSRQADPSTIQVLVNNTPLSKDTSGSGYGWTYELDTNSIIFGYQTIPPRGSKIKISYNSGC